MVVNNWKFNIFHAKKCTNHHLLHKQYPNTNTFKCSVYLFIVWMHKMLYNNMSVQAVYLARNAQYWNSSELHNANLTYLKHQNVSFYDTLCLKLQTTVSSDLRACWAWGSFGIFWEIICRGMIYYMFKSIHDLLMTRRSGVCYKCRLDQPASQSRN